MLGNGGEVVSNKEYSSVKTFDIEKDSEESIVIEAKSGNTRAQEYIISK